MTSHRPPLPSPLVIARQILSHHFYTNGLVTVPILFGSELGPAPLPNSHCNKKVVSSSKYSTLSRTREERLRHSMSIRRYQPINNPDAPRKIVKKDHERYCDQSMQLIPCGGRLTLEQLLLGD